MAHRIDVTLDGLHQLLHRIERKELGDGDWAVCRALVLQLITRIQGKQDRMTAKLAANAASASAEVVEGALAVNGAAPALAAGQKPDAPPASDDAGAPESKKKVKGHGRIVRADAPSKILEGVGSSYAVYDWSARAMLAVMHYFAAAPFKRLESLHEGWGLPLPDANLWRLADETDDLLLPLYRALELHGVQNATSLRIDDTGSMVVALARQIQAEVAALEQLGESTQGVRTGINATGVLLETAGGTVILFFTGRHHAGEVLDRLLKRRTPGGPRLVKVTDGASKKFDHQHRGELVEATCNAHAFLKFHDIKDKHPTEYAVAGEVYKGVFDNDDEAKARRLTPDERMLFHREHSKPLMEKLKALCEEKLRRKLVEPSSALWEPLSFIINQWPRLTRFYEEPGVPLDTNLVEQKLIIPVRYLAASFNYKTETGAEVGDRMMSLIATAHANGVEPVAYLTHCLRHHEDLSKRPADYLPWAYRDGERQPASTGPPVATPALTG